jgi:Reverse transcriptase (RNA-dependent DNA polymerase)
MIEKIVGNPLIEKLRVIHLFEADYNLLLKIVWARKGVWNAHYNQLLNKGQAGSRPGKRAIDVVINKELKYQYARFTRTNLGTIDNDAKSCYDRIICSVAMLISQYYGIPWNFCNMQAENLRKTKFHIRTANGDSNEYYIHNEDNPIYGTGQGSCSSPAIWLFISSFIMDCLQKEANGMNMRDMVNISNDVMSWIEGFVDDTSIFTNIDYYNSDLKTLKTKLSEDGNRWSKLLWATGGKLEASKCFYYLLSWKFDDNGFPVPESIEEQTLKDNHGNILSIPDGNSTILKQVETTTSHKTLGAMKCIFGPETAQIKHLQDKSNKFIKKAIGSQINRRMAKRAFSMCYIPSMLYSLVATCLKDKQINDIQQNATTTFIRLMGFEKCFPRAVVYGPKIFGGLGLPKLSVETNCNKLETIMCHLNNMTDLGEVIQLCMNLFQIHSGSCIPMMINDNEIDYIDQNWFDSVREFLLTIGARLIIHNTWVPQLLRDKDYTIMDRIHKANFSKTQRRQFNAWRLYFQINTIAEITNYTGDRIRREFHKIM